MKRFSSIVISFSLLIAPLAAFAQQVPVESVLQVTNEQNVSRGDFIRAAIKTFDIDEPSGTINLPFLRVPRAMEPYIKTAQSKNALKLFGSDLLLARPIKRGEALYVLVKLLNASSDIAVDFNDVREGTDVDAAVRVAMEKNWMAPLTADVFGVNRNLLGKDAILLLRKARGEGNATPAQPSTSQQNQTIRVNFTSNERLLNLPKTQLLESIWKIINEEFLYEEKIDTDEAAYGAAEALLNSLGDKYTSFFRPVKNRNFQSQLQSEVSGIGAQVEHIDGILTIVTPIVGSPAEQAGLKPGDQILMADGVSLANMDFLEAVDHVRGPQGSVVTLRIRRNGVEFDVKVTRSVIQVPEIIITWQGKVVVVRLTQFGSLTQNQFRSQMEQLKAQQPTGFILDLRNNPGGLLNAAGVVSTTFLPLDTDVVEIRSKNSRRMDSTNLEPIFPNIPMVVLVNEGSASASEIVAGALQDSGRAKVVGTKTFGKGTVQEVLQFNDQSGMKLTVAEWYTPKGHKIDGNGVIPDIVVEKPDERDDQMVKALELLR